MKKFSLIVRIIEFKSNDYIDCIIKKSKFDYDFNEFLEGGVNILLSDNFGDTGLLSGLYKITGSFCLNGCESYIPGEPTEYDAWYEWENIKIKRICKRK